MSPEATQLLEQVLALPADERVALAQRVLDSVEVDREDAEWESELLKEFERQAAAAQQEDAADWEPIDTLPEERPANKKRSSKS